MNKPYLRFAIGYLALGVFWIVFSDRSIELLSATIGGLTFLQTVKGLFFVLASTALVYAITKKAFTEERQKEQEKQLVYKSTVDGVHHIAFNYLNNMQLVLLEAEQCERFDREILSLAKTSSRIVQRELSKLAAVREVTPDGIDAVLYEADLGGDKTVG